ncbi:MAG: AMP-binding protein, partial [Deltaproteobacteria bacterium]|nr:AMP-binding protein [Deltaproteobacteria bacterium]
GMAENTLAATVTRMEDEVSVDWVDVRSLYDKRKAVPVDSDKKGSLPLVSCGLPLDGVDVGIVDSSRSHLPERSVGEIAIRTGFLFNGYHQNPELTANVMQDGWYYTGDIGYLAKGHLYVCGRKKDLIIIVMVCELTSGTPKEERGNIGRELRRRIFHELYVSVSEVRFVESGWIVKTYNGRMVRSANRMKYLKEQI